MGLKMQLNHGGKNINTGKIHCRSEDFGTFNQKKMIWILIFTVLKKISAFMTSFSKEKLLQRYSKITICILKYKIMWSFSTTCKNTNKPAACFQRILIICIWKSVFSLQENKTSTRLDILFFFPPSGKYSFLVLRASSSSLKRDEEWSGTHQTSACENLSGCRLCLWN